MSKYSCEKCGKELKPNELKYVSCGSYEFMCNDCAEKQIPSKLMEKIADLEAKLAESEARIAEQDKHMTDQNIVWNISKKQNEQLKQQLAEKDEEIKHRHWAIKSGVYIQDKISFCIEQLEQIKRFYNEYNNSDRHTTYEVKYQLDRKIEELKNQLTHQHEDKGE